MIVLAIGALANTPLPTENTLGLGGPCGGSNPLFVVTSFTVSPWPVTAGEIVTFYMNGVFRAADRISQLKIATQYERGQINYINWDIDTSYSAGQTATFSYGLQIGSFPGTYTETFTLEDGSSTFIACWAFQYSI